MSAAAFSASFLTIAYLDGLGCSNSLNLYLSLYSWIIRSTNGDKSVLLFIISNSPPFLD
nr:MAG TPA: hypothetical protein [Caudoviricetes sp.]